MSADTCWAIRPLGEIADFINGDRGKNYPTSSDYVGSGIPFVSASDLDGRSVNLSGATYISEEAYDRLGNGKIIQGDILFCLRGSLGKIGLAKGIPKGAIASSLVIIRPKEGVSLDFLYYILSSSIGKSIARELDNGSVQGNLSVRELKQVEIELPEHQEQKAIAHILGTLDDKIELNRKTNETLEAMAKALFKSWFVDFDPVRAKAEGRPTGLPDELSDLFPDSFEDSELGEIPSGWEPKTIREWGRTECGKTPSTHNQEFYGNDYMFVTIPDLHNGFHVVSSGKQLSKLGADSQRKKLLPPGSVMVSCIATPGLVGVAKEECFTNQQINSIIPNSKEASWFLALAMIENRDLLLSLGGGGSVFFNLSKGRFDEIDILAPSEDLISAFSGVVSTLMDRCFATKQETIALAKTRDTLLPKLISGEIRIPDAERMLEEVGV